MQFNSYETFQIIIMIDRIVITESDKNASNRKTLFYLFAIFIWITVHMNEYFLKISCKDAKG